MQIKTFGAIIVVILLVAIIWNFSGQKQAFTLLGWTGTGGASITDVRQVDNKCWEIDFNTLYTPENNPYDNNIRINKYAGSQFGCQFNAETFLECWGIPAKDIDAFTSAYIEGSFSCYTQCPYPQSEGRFEDLEQISTVAGEIKVSFPNFQCPPIQECSSAQGFLGSGTMKICKEEQIICPAIIGWRIENNICVSDSGCDYDATKYTYYSTLENCENALTTPVVPGPVVPPEQPNWLLWIAVIFIAFASIFMLWAIRR